MAITDISISEELETNAPSIKYSGNEGPKAPLAKGPIIPSDEDPINPFGPRPKKMAFDDTSGFELEELKLLMEEFEEDNGRSPTSIDDLKRYFKIKYGKDRLSEVEETVSDRQMAAYGGIMGMDGRKQYGIGSWFQEAKDKIVDDLIPNEIKENPLLTAALVAGGDYALNEGKLSKGVLNSIFGKDVVSGTSDGGTTTNREGGLLDILKRAGSGVVDTGKKIFDFKTGEDRTLGGDILGGISKNIVPIVGGLTAGLFTKNTEDDTPGLPNDNTALQLADLKKSANLLDQKQGLATGLNFLPTVASRKYSPEEMAVTYAKAANGGRIGFDNGGGVINPFNEFETFKLKNLGYDVAGRGTEPFGGESVLRDILRVNRATGGRMGFEEGGGIMDLGGMEKDYRAEGGFVPIGREEKADDVPARLSVNEFVFTADAVRNAGGGDIDQGAQVMENMMKHLEQGGQVSEESQGMQGARDMFATSERLGEVI